MTAEAEVFKAGAHYGDWKGSVAGDEEIGEPNKAIRNWLKERKLLADDEFLIGIRIFANFPGGKFKDLTAIFYATAESDKEPSEGHGDYLARKFIVDISPTDFFNHFKEFELTLSFKGALEGKAIKAWRAKDP